MKKNPIPKNLFRTAEEARAESRFGKGSGNVQTIRNVLSRAYSEYFKDETPESVAKMIKTFEEKELNALPRTLLIKLFENTATPTEKKSVNLNVKGSKDFTLAMTHLIQTMIRSGVLNKTDAKGVYTIPNFVLYFKYFGVPDNYFTKVGSGKRASAKVKSAKNKNTTSLDI